MLQKLAVPKHSERYCAIKWAWHMHTCDFMSAAQHARLWQ